MSRYRLLPTPAQEAVLRDFARAMAAFFGPHNPAGRPSWRKAGRDEGFRIVGQRGRQWDVRRLSRKTGEVWVPKAGWVRFRWSRAVSPGVKIAAGHAVTAWGGDGVARLANREPQLLASLTGCE